MKTAHNKSPRILRWKLTVGNQALLECFSPFLWFALYNIVYSVSGAFAKSVIPCAWIVPGAVAGYTFFLVRWTAKRGGKWRLCSFSCKLPTGKDLAFLPVLLIQPVYNLLFGMRSVAAASVVLVLSAAIIEEIFFRGFLLSFLIKKNVPWAIMAASFVFAAFHAVNLLSGAEGWYVLLQAFCAFSLGVCYSAAAIQFKSLLPSVAAHGLVNITGLCALPFPENGIQIHGLILCTFVELLWGIIYISRHLLLQKGNDV